ncbi:RNA polymerase sigma-32 factor [Neorickettsia helminthoeca str. Oregon]|uniref:RNA polymerase sigma-32 factor n=1 Tax=Neorickettsia helminthoeca str. Oregon TaxID=1286528 RepID=X5GW30_9RICK|nr:RNA polymerase factor sigma-32 [Neorickettsia helminthoeca]AHX11282.1 RNA polymerase sigma-32 factor [Neorickettsia helminthoeca str. Oregon]
MVGFLLSLDNSEFDRYARKVLAIPMLEEDEERSLLERWCVHKDVEAAQKLVEAYLRLVVKVVMRFKNYGLPLMDLASEGNIGLMKAIKNFDNTLGYKIATYAVWWIKAAINEYIIRSWSMVKIGTTAAQRKLFFNLRKLKNSIDSCGLEKGQMVEKISKLLDVPESDVKEMEAILSSKDVSLNARIGEDDGTEVHDMLAGPGPDQESLLSDEQQRRIKANLLKEAVDSLDDRHRKIFILRSLSSTPSTLKELSEKFSISQERVRQIHVRAMEKVKEYVQTHRSALGMV